MLKLSLLFCLYQLAFAGIANWETCNPSDVYNCDSDETGDPFYCCEPPEGDNGKTTCRPHYQCGHIPSPNRKLCSVVVVFLMIKGTNLNAVQRLATNQKKNLSPTLGMPEINFIFILLNSKFYYFNLSFFFLKFIILIVAVVFGLFSL